ncbi:Glucosamine-6-phosphate isomerase (Glucosamine-6-phosphate deaminase) (GNPDA) (GlcN6P deaminase) [Exophiala xenobiotica]|uniref:Glucosamine-6-phosphate isomerase n=1 Tax=Vermiconidia calcicola TaxID=1690605 RepID=A0AAV9PWS6_9PEZI|nr:Glucosamine-6-phosphate isomerase (Glucosamine-6-phosphate deaminase) (GNPDA) (GlcN6P deaminase) [Exophiala xenobiotica]KAK5428205.1 Glucosamine-6-phosphate isomerase (Glucosamine-6-phosphate deaminase) (GNPDA) (GlcN6P deaminase) [Exophiala xenobiotica]KAK5530829.1 Glucosamine-6-phosphate isomerase (Glucosamine-6-phosphate deaminase) (GNPDA) (GlcN6P deaminase) [Vermiconidia calcicola]KAK5531224.1 Glucosamine-6-phosphate isomerase (Glucosamine-6-phosphate deaminase) (GNPDA) (GlcN6P deaminase) 
MRLIIRGDPTAASQYIADHIAHSINTFSPTPSKPFFVLGLPTGGSPKIIYSLLVQLYEVGDLSFKNVITFNMDEYMGIPKHHPESYHTFMHNNLFSHVDIDPANINILNGEASDPAAECLEYEDKIRRVGGIDFFLGGVGPNGHLAFNEPGSSFASRTRVMTLAYETRVANSRFFGGDVTCVPEAALTVGVQTVMKAREVVIIATGSNKALAIQRCVESSVSHMCPVSCLQMHPNAMIVVDEGAIDELTIRTVRYFKDVEADKRSS